MDYIQEQFIKILSLAIHGKKIDNTLVDEKMEWDKIFEEATAHNVRGLIYSALDKSIIDTIDKDLVDKFKKCTFVEGVYQVNHIKQMGRIFNIFNRQNIEVIALKGLVVRRYYARPELRTMCDGDILVKKEDLLKVKKILEEFEYEDEGGEINHLTFKHKFYFSIEVHWSITNEEYFKGNKEFFDKVIWQNTQITNVGGSCVNELTLEFLIVYLCMHMATHCSYCGFGIRQITDLVLVIENEKDAIDWNITFELARLCKLEKFMSIILNVCEKLFNFKLPYDIKSLNKKEEKNIKIFMEEIFSNGVFGKRDRSKILVKQINFKNKENNESYIIKEIIFLIFPSRKKLTNKYNYAKKNFLLLPVAWIHHLISGIFNKDYEVKDKFKCAIYAMKIAKKKNKLINWLEL
ncbi:nucleotidyltransferase domain-containing protein [Clostridium tarantellae]|nr:nucleotidyltransferase family protein [Clostridium tarantellae]